MSAAGGKTHLLSALWSLGVLNCFRVADYRLRGKLGIYRRLTPLASLPRIGASLRDARAIPLAASPRAPTALVDAAERVLKGELSYFARHLKSIGSPPDWFRDPWTGRTWPGATSHWSDINEFVAAGSDIKVVWDPSRFEWMVLLARAYALTNRREFLDTLSLWLDSWIENNPPNCGVNWKCGQECSIRLLRFLEAMQSIDWPDSAASALQAFVVAHLRRIRSTLMYAVAQDNNHGTSEAAAMFVGGHWLLATGASGDTASFAKATARKGLHQLEERIDRLVMADGTFSQYSANYHRMLLDTMSIVEIWRRRYGLPTLSARCVEKVRAAVEWLASMVSASTGHAPNLGANDGSLLLISPATAYEDHRPTLQLACCLLKQSRAYPPGVWDDASRLWGIEPDAFPLSACEQRAHAALDGGFISLEGEDGKSWGLIRVPHFSFRPSQADALHFDLWIDGENVVRDTGSFSYNDAEGWHEYFSGTAAHSTCQFDERDQMPRAGRFLFSRWLAYDELQFIGDGSRRQGVEVSYTDHWGASHRRRVTTEGSHWLIEDQLAGYQRCAIVRWHLAPGPWSLDGNRAIGSATIEVDTPAGAEIRLTHGWESRAYLERTPIPVLEVRLPAPRSVLRTRISPPSRTDA